MDNFKQMMMKSRAKATPSKDEKREELIKRKREEKLRQKMAKQNEEQRRKELAEKIAKQTKAKVAASKKKKEMEAKTKDSGLKMKKTESQTSEDSRMEELMKKQKMKALKAVMARERNNGMKVASEADSKIKEMMNKNKEKPKVNRSRPSSGKKPEQRPSNLNGPNGNYRNENLERIERKRLAEIQRRKQELLNKRRKTDTKPSMPPPTPTPSSTAPPPKKPVPTYFCKRCNRTHEIDYHQKLLDAKLGLNKPQTVTRKASSASSAKRRNSHYDEEDDLDGFIVDDIDDAGRKQASSVIRQMYGRTNYSNNYSEDDDSCMEAGYDDIQREEFISKRIARKEDELEEKRMLARGENPYR